MAMKRRSSDDVPHELRAKARPLRPQDDDPSDTLDTIDDAQERGNGLETSKAIARGGKSTGHVPGAMPATDE
jgi:hypothetical protein